MVLECNNARDGELKRHLDGEVRQKCSNNATEV
jgi:hypothetical protein